MRRSLILEAVTAAAVLSIGCAAPSPPAPEDAGTAEATDDQQSSIPAYQPKPGRDRPVVAVLAHHEGAEVTDFVVPHGILATSGVADVVAVTTGQGPIEMMPALTIEADVSTERFDRQYPEGADYVIVPAVHRPDAPELTSWIRAQAAAGATIVGVCDGVLVLASAGLLEGRRATGHWYSLGRLERKHPDTDWVRNRRYVADGNVITTTGVSASVPVSLALVEAIAGAERARRVASSWAMEGWSPDHDSDAYGLEARHVFTWLGGMIAFWRNDTYAVPVEDGVDEVTLSLFADAWSRTSRSRALTVAAVEGPIRTRGGLRLLPDRVRAPTERPDPEPAGLTPLEPLTTLDGALAGIAEAYGAGTADFVALQLEYDGLAADAGGR